MADWHRFKFIERTKVWVWLFFYVDGDDLSDETVRKCPSLAGFEHSKDRRYLVTGTILVVHYVLSSTYRC